MNRLLKPDILRLRNEGKTYPEICKILTTTLGNVAYHCNETSKLKARFSNKKCRTKNIKDAKMLTGGKCCKCGYSKCMAALHFHHIKERTNYRDRNGNTCGPVTLFKLKSKKIALEEIKKCILICANCHAEEHWPDKMTASIPKQTP